ncbi:MAG: molybdopterin molybdenumtransferase MoeA [Methylomarinum sp.]|nr:molybdopterin molybdenumtransferase MoeA [Methylomarinum sp.]
MIETQPSCTDIYESGLLPVDQALKNILSALPAIDDYQIIPIEKAKARTLAQDIIAPFNVPHHNNSAVDGYALNSKDLPSEGLASLSIIDSAYAGNPCASSLSVGQCIRIMTGAKIPDGVDTVIMQEHVELKHQSILIDNRHKAGQNIRLAGEDIRHEETILHAGKFITPADIGLIASLGIGEIKVRRKLKVAIASTGNEVISIGDQHTGNSLYDSNRYSLFATLDRPDIKIINLGILEDDPVALLKQFKQASEYADLIISSGGVSVGDADHTKTALKQSGQVDFWKIAIKPGRPLAFGHIGDSVFFGLPGNPVAVMVTFYQFVLPALEQMLGINDKIINPKLQVKSTENIRKKSGRTEIVRGILQQASDGTLSIKTTGKQGSGILSSMSLANAFIILEHDRKSIKTGETVTVQPFVGLF